MLVLVLVQKVFDPATTDDARDRDESSIDLTLLLEHYDQRNTKNGTTNLHIRGT